MRILESNLKPLIKHTHLLKAGPVFVFDTFLVTEFHEGSVVDYDCFKALYSLLDRYSKGDRAFGFLSNRVNSYSVKATDFVSLNKERNTEQKYLSAIVTYDTFGQQMFSFEKQIYKCSSEVFTGIEPALHWLDSQRSFAC
ncbi:MAG: hypothetical protein ABNH00_01020 [Dokdonia sp.]|jgi:hypothetical protein